MQLADLSSLKVTVMGLGLHGGGLASALFFARHGARVTVTDNRDDPQVFAPILPRLEAAGVRAVLGRHDRSDFIQTDMIIKNPAVPGSSAFLQIARDHGRPIETDLSVFLQLCGNSLIAVTGSKGKSTTASAIHHCLLAIHPDARLGGTITVSPLIFLDEIGPNAPVVLELSSWQLADIREGGLLAPLVSVVTVILPDHQDRYPEMASYIADKKTIFASQKTDQYALFNLQDPLQRGFERETRARPRFFSGVTLDPGLEGAFLRDKEAAFREGTGETAREIPFTLDPLKLPGAHNRMNLLAAALDSLAPPVRLIAGGTDKQLGFQPLLGSIHRAERIILLQGSATEKMRALFEKESIPYEGPYETLEEAVRRAARGAKPGTSVLFSPGCASFELFLNEFDRGRTFKRLVGDFE